MSCEEWRPIPGAEFYEVSTLGRVRSVPHKTTRGRILKIALDHKRYPRVTLPFNGRRRSVTVHKLIALTFLPRQPGCDQINHKNGIKDDNRLVNLEWTNARDNIHHAVRNGLHKSVRQKFHADEHERIRDLFLTGLISKAELARAFKCTKSTIGAIINQTGRVVDRTKERAAYRESVKEGG